MKRFFAKLKETTKDMTTREKVGYILYAYWLEIFGILLGIALLVGVVFIVDNKTNTRILYAVLVDSAFDGNQTNALASGFKAYIGNDRRKDKVYFDTNVSVLGAVVPEDENAAEYSELYEFQQKSLILMGTGLVDLYVCEDRYAQYLTDYQDIMPVSQALGEELCMRFGDRITEDRYVSLTAEQAEMCGVTYANPCMVFTQNAHFPETIRSFAEYILQTGGK